jgi:hypothetical protein
MKVKYEALRRQLKRARKRGDVHQVNLTSQLITQLVASSMNSASTADSTSSSGSIGSSSHVSEKLQVHNSLRCRRRLHMCVMKRPMPLPLLFWPLRWVISSVQAILRCSEQCSELAAVARWVWR